MSEAIFNEQDREVISMVNDHARKAGAPTKCVIVPLHKAKQYEQKNNEKQQLRRIGVAAARCGLGLLCISAMVNGLMDPALACVAAMGCVAWAAAGYRRGANG